MQTLRIYHLIHKRQARKKEEQHRPSVVLGRWSLMVSVFLFMLVLAGILYGTMRLALTIDLLPPISQLEDLLDPENGSLLTPSHLLDRSGEITLLVLQPADMERRFLALDGEDAFSPWLPLLTVAVNDPDFWQRSILEPFLSEADTQSGIAHDLVKELLLWQYPQGGQFQQDLLTAQLLLQYDHKQVLTWYLNSEEYGAMVYGAEQAAQLFLGKSAADLSLAEAALLVASAQYPALNPWDAPAAALENMNILLLEMLEADVISLKDFESALHSEVQLTSRPDRPQQATDAFSEAVLELLSAEIPHQRLERGGFSIITTLDSHLQSQMECSTRIQFERIDASNANASSDLNECPAARLLSPLPPDTGGFDPQGLQASALIMDPRSGEVLAYLDRETQQNEQTLPLEQQPGSLLSTFVALTAFTRGAGPASLRWDIPADESATLTPYIAADESYQGPMRARLALANDDALVFAEWMDELGSADVLSLTSQFGWHLADAEAVDAALVFAGGETDLLQTALAYSTFANLGTQYGIESSDGQTLQPQLILSVSSNETDLVDLQCTQTQSSSLLSPALAFLIHDMLADEVSRRARLGYPSPLSIGRPSAAKIASAAHDTQSWTVGYTPERLVLTWFGSPQESLPDYRLSAGLWHALIQYSSQNLPVQGWEQPAGISQIVVCDPSGLLPSADCPSLVNELFLSGNEPGAFDDLYRKVAINRETGRLATVFTPLELVEEKTFLIVPAEAEAWAQSQGLPVPPSAYDAISISNPQPDANITSPAIFSYVQGQVNFIGTAAGEGFSNFRLQVGAGLNPQEWFQIGEVSTRAVANDTLAQWDTTNLNGLYAIRLIVQRSTQEIETAVIQVTVDNTSPTMTILSPQPGDTLQRTASGEVNLQVRPDDNIGIDRVLWYIDGQLAAERAQAPYSAFLPLKSGEHLLIVEVIDLAGNSTRSEDYLFSVQ